jgi:hypothetical protein
VMTSRFTFLHLVITKLVVRSAKKSSRLQPA